MPNPTLIMDHYEDREIRTLSWQWIRDDHRVFFSLRVALGCQNSTKHTMYNTRIPYLHDSPWHWPNRVTSSPTQLRLAVMNLFFSFFFWSSYAARPELSLSLPGLGILPSSSYTPL